MKSVHGPLQLHFLQSATQFVLVVFACVLSLSILWIVVNNPHDHDLNIGLLGLFSNALIGVISFYFGQKGLPPAPKQPDMVKTESTTISDSASPLAENPPPFDE